MGAVREPDGRRGATDFLHGHDVGQIAQPRTAVVFSGRYTEQAEFAEFGPQVTRKLVAGIDLCGARRNSVGREALHCLAQEIDVFTKAKIEVIHHAHNFPQISSL